MKGVDTIYQSDKLIIEVIKQKHMTSHRHGEVSLIPTTLPAGAKLISESKSVIAGHSESGHHHVMTADTPIKVYEHNGLTYLVNETTAHLTHQKEGTETHGVQILNPATWVKPVKKSFSYITSIMRRVQD